MKFIYWCASNEKVLRGKYFKILGLLMGAVFATTSLLFGYANYESVKTSADIAKSKMPVTIIMYHSILKDNNRLGKFTLSVEQLENDIKYLVDNGCNFVTVTDLINFVNDENAVLPDNAVMITFDDGHYNFYVYVYPLLQKYNAKAVFSIVGKYADDNKEGEKLSANYSYATWDQIKEMHDSGYVEIQNHSYDLHSVTKKRNGSGKNKGETLQEYEKTLAEDLSKLQDILKERVGATPNTFTYPFGEISTESVTILKSLGFSASLSCFSGINYIEKGNADALFKLKRYNRPHGKESKSFFKNKLNLKD